MLSAYFENPATRRRRFWLVYSILTVVFAIPLSFLYHFDSWQLSPFLSMLVAIGISGIVVYQVFKMIYFNDTLGYYSIRHGDTQKLTISSVPFAVVVITTPEDTFCSITINPNNTLRGLAWEKTEVKRQGLQNHEIDFVSRGSSETITIHLDPKHNWITAKRRVL